MHEWDSSNGFSGLLIHQNDNAATDPLTCPSGQVRSQTTGACVDPNRFRPEKNNGDPECKAKAGCGNPINTGAGNKFQAEMDFDVGGLSFNRYYNSVAGTVQDANLGYQWRHTYARKIEHVQDTSGARIANLFRPDGNQIRFTWNGASWVAEPDQAGVLTELRVADQTEGWLYTEDGGRTLESFDAGGKLEAITGPDASRNVTLAYSDATTPTTIAPAAGLLIAVANGAGRNINFVYNADSRIVEIVTPDGAYQYRYSAAANLEKVIAPGNHERVYMYGEPEFTSSADLPVALTGIIDENGDRFATFAYAANGMAISTEHAGGTQKFTATYDLAVSAQIQDPNGATLNRTFTVKNGVVLLSSQTITCAGCTPKTQSLTYDAAGRQDVATDYSGVTVDHDYSVRGLLTQKIEAADDTTGKKRTIQTDWHTGFDVPVERRVYDSGTSVPGVLRSKTNWAYNSRGQPLTVTQTDLATGATRTTTTTYCEQTSIDAGTCPLLGLVTSVNGPRTDVSDVTTYTYYPSDDASCATQPTTCPHRKGDLWKITNALGQVTETLKYDGAGRVLSAKDANGVITDLEYHPRGWLTARKVRGADDATETDDAITRIEYWPTGLVKQVTQPDGAFTTYTYDAAHRLTDIADNVANTIHYTLDNAGNRTGEDTKDNTGTLLRTLSRVYNQLGQLQTAKDAYQQPTGFGYDANGNTDTVTDALNRVTDSDYDPLNRLAKTIQDVGGINATTQFQYDALDNLAQVTDPKGLNTGYARGVTATYSYDALNRLIGITYPNSVHNITYTYDTTQGACITGETFTTGRLAKMVDGSGDTQYCYDRFGHLVRKVQTTNTKVFTVRYAYTKAGRLSSVTYPDGTTVDYVRDGQGRITEVGSTRSGSTRQVLLSQATYYPFGPVAEWVYGNGRLMERSLNQNYQPGIVQDGFSTGISIGYEFDEVGNLVKLRNGDQSEPPRRLFGYDTLNRLTETKDGTTLALLQAYSYDETGNRLSSTAGATTTYTYFPTSHRLSQVGTVVRTYDAAGNTATIDGTAKQFLYNDTGRMSQFSVKNKAARYYRYNGRGEQVHKYVSTTHFYTAYDEAGHWLGDYDGNGTAIQQAIWLDDLPVGLLIGAGVNQKVHYIEADALGSPRVVIDPVRDVAVWNWDIAGEAFGNTVPNQDPDGDGTNLIFHMRFPGQRFDAVSGLNYNYFRDYEPGTGRYVESDPIGFYGSISTFSYVESSPLLGADANGLEATNGNAVIACGGLWSWMFKKGAEKGAEKVLCDRDDKDCHKKCDCKWKIRNAKCWSNPTCLELSRATLTKCFEQCAYSGVYFNDPNDEKVTK